MANNIDLSKYGVNALRESFLSFFESKGHLRLPSASLIPQNDNSLLLINSGMAPLKPYFTRQVTPPRDRVTTCQKCIRTGDIDNIGKTARHGTFFEMLGNFSFADYFKKEAIFWSWEFLTEVIGFDKDRLYPSVYVDDDEAFNLWHNMIGISKDRIFKFGKEDNFWEHGSGPCGPCSEIYYDRGEKYGCGKEGCTVGCDCDRYMEIWNNVFTQFDSDGNGHYTELANKNIDTGMGLERLAVACQDVDSIFVVDTNKKLMDDVCALASCKYGAEYTKDVSLRIIADHIKSCTFMISDGILPKNDGRGYVLKRLLRRAVLNGRKLGINHTFMKELAKTVVSLSKTGYPELEDRQDLIIKTLEAEENNFNLTIDQGLEILNEYADEIKKSDSGILSGDKAFKLYDTYGFPIDLTKEILEEKNIKVDETEYNKLMLNQKETARSARSKSNYMGADVTIYQSIDPNLKTDFVGYDNLNYDSKITVLTSDDSFVDELKEGDEGTIFVEKSPFYATMGGQEHDNGLITDGNNVFEVKNVFKVADNKIAHFGVVKSGNFKKGEIVNLEVDEKRRNDIARNHSATHLLQAALRQVLGSHVEQAGSLVSDDRLRFDFTHFNQMSQDEILKVEALVNANIAKSTAVAIKEMPIDDARKAGATALFGEKYGNIVRTVKMGDFSFELCGGTHVHNTSEIDHFKIISEESVSQGVRRIEAITGSALKNYNEKNTKILEELASILKTNIYGVEGKLNSLLSENDDLKKEITKLKNEKAKNVASDIEVEKNGDIKYVVKEFDNMDMNGLRKIGDDLKSKNDNIVIVLASINNDAPNFVCMISDSIAGKKISAKDIISKIAPIAGGKGGGRDNMAQAGGKDKTKINEALNVARDLIKNI